MDNDLYLYSNGQMATNWSKLGDDSYYFDGHSGKMMTNTWIQGDDNGDWYFVDSDGKMKTKCIFKNIGYK